MSVVKPDVFYATVEEAILRFDTYSVDEWVEFLGASIPPSKILEKQDTLSVAAENGGAIENPATWNQLPSRSTTTCLNGSSSFAKVVLT